MTIKELLSNVFNKKKKFKEYSDDLDIEEKAHNRRLTANERELNRFMEEARQKKIKSALEKYRKAKFQEDNYGHQILNKENHFRGKGVILKNNKSLMTNNPKVYCDKRYIFK